MQSWWPGFADTPPHDARVLHTLGLGFMAARTLAVALEFSLFTHLAGQTLSLAQVAQALQLAERPAGRLLRACAALGLVQIATEGFCNTPLSEKYLVEGRPTFIGSYLQLFDVLGYHRWEQLGPALRHNAPVDALHHPYRYLADDAEAAHTFLTAQHAGSLSLGHALARRFDFRPFRCLLDLGGGSGAYTIEILQRYPHLRAILFDFPEVCRLAKAAIQRAGLTTRVRIVSGDYERDPLPSGPDVVLWSGNLHASSPARCAQVLRTLRALLPPGGTVLIHDYLLDDTRTKPLIPALLDLHMTLVSEDGQVYSAAELRTLLSQAGFTEVHISPLLAEQSGLVIARLGKENT